jgi:hypothetical protein
MKNDKINIQKKIIIYLFINYLINVNIANLINCNIRNKLKSNYILEYNLPKEVVNINLQNIFTEEFISDLQKYIYNITLFDPNYPSDYNGPYTNPIIQTILVSLNADTLVTTTPADFINICSIYSDSYVINIGNYSTITNDLIFSEVASISDISYSANVYDYNVIINNDQNTANVHNYEITNMVNNVLDIYYKTNIYDINTVTANSSITVSQFMINGNKFYDKTSIINFNLLYILMIKILNYYDITYTTQNDDIDTVLGNLRIINSYMNQNIELLKGFTSNNIIANDMINFNQNQINDLYKTFSRSKNITQLTKLVNNTNNFSNILPNDYDYDVINLNFSNIYNNSINIYKKFYYYNYNNYEYPENYYTIYQAKILYYNNIINNTYSLLNIKESDINLFINLFIDIMYTYLSTPYFDYDANNNIFIDPLNKIIQLYMKYNFTFTLNNNLSDYKNLVLQSSIKREANNLTTLEQIKEFIIKVYFYELYGKDISDINYNTTQ